MTNNGIDLSKSGWENPEGFERSPRPSVAVPQVAACEAPGPAGWVCDLKPGHEPRDQHRADDGTSQGIRWHGAMADVSTVSDQEPILIPAYVTPEQIRAGDMAELKVRYLAANGVTDPLGQIAAIAEKALASQSPAAWAVALDKILTLARS